MITVGIPVYNDECYIEQAVMSVVNQADMVLISDNASTDRTSQICEELANRFSNIKYVRHSSNLGATFNFKYCIDAAENDYFMWLGSHDKVPPDYIQKLLNRLKSTKDAVMAFAPTKYIDLAENELEWCRFPYHEELCHHEAKARVNSLIDHLSDCSLMHGVFMTEVLRRSWVNIPCLGIDHILLCNVAVEGLFIYEPSTCFIRRRNREESDYHAANRRLRMLNNEYSHKSLYFGMYDCFQDMIIGQLEAYMRAAYDDATNLAMRTLNATKRLEQRFRNTDLANYYKTNWMQLLLQGKNISAVLPKYFINEVAIFGTGIIAEMLYQELMNSKINVTAFIDNNTKEKRFLGIPVYSINMITADFHVDAVLSSIEGNHDVNVINRIKNNFNEHTQFLSWKDLVYLNLIE